MVYPERTWQEANTINVNVGIIVQTKSKLKQTDWNFTLMYNAMLSGMPPHTEL
jgi:hypothetical protein